MEGEREKSRDQTEGSGQQQPLSQQSNQTIEPGEQRPGQPGTQPPSGQGGQQPLGGQGNFGTQEPGLGRQTDQEFGGSGGHSAAGQAQGDTRTVSKGEGEVGPGGYSPESGASDLGGGETGLGDRNQGGFVGSQAQDSGEYLQQGGNPESGFAEQGRGASNRDAQGSDSEDGDIDGSSDNS